ncbi:MAG: alpha/beta fold hydrolase [Smithellaceae bacterium]|jgi:esterase/lipase/1-acyl-sn-glycerol-3-phosphate acyltransferase
MNMSNTLIKTIMVTLDALIKASGTDIRIHGANSVPDQPVLYVINHFTRMETILMPYVIKKSIKKYPISLADSSFFGGKMGELMDKLGAISTTNPERDALLINALLTGSNPVIIFPEGQMIKDKKIIEKGKYMVYNTGIRRPPHTGAGRIALRSQFIREELRFLCDRGDDSSIKKIASHFGFDPAHVDKILQQETYIVPVNITYYPVRARNNAINKIVNIFVDKVSARLEEEMQVEGSMIMDGVDIDINFGQPISMKNYITASVGVKKMLADNNLYLHPGELKYVSPFKKLYIGIMYDYMDAIYSMTTVNHDHLFSYILTKYNRNKISENDFKNRVFLAIEHLRASGLTNYHTSLNKKQFYLLTDDYHEEYESFIKAALSENLITLRDGIITKNHERFSTKYDFQTIRKDNIIEVLKNEIEPLQELTKALDRLMLLPAGFIRRKIRNHFIELEDQLFEQDYQQYYIKDESKPRNIGKPFFLKHFFGNKGVILIHGYMAAPEEIRPLAEYLYKNRYNVYGARLRGHGTAPEDLAGRSWQKWYDSVSRAYIIMKNSMKPFAIGGFSTGAGIALLQASNKPGRFAGVISINAPLKLQDISSRFSSVVVAWNKFLSKINTSKGKMEFIANDPENPHINYLRNPVSGVNELEKLMNLVEERLKYIKDPTLVIQGSEDPVVNPVSGREILKKLGAPKKELIRIDAKHHGILRGKEAGQVNAKVLEFLRSVF